MSKTVTPSTFVRNLGPGLMRLLSDFLDPQDGWKKLAMVIQKASGEPRYTQMHIRRFEGTVLKGKSPTQELLYDWGTTNCTVNDLIDLLVKTDFLTAASLLLPDVSVCSYKEQEISSACPTIPVTDLEKPQPIAEDCSRTESGIPVSQSTEPEENDEETGFGVFSYHELQRITNNFDDRPLKEGGNKIGEGGFGVVFQGQITSEKVAVKKLTPVVDGSLQDLKEQFHQEIKTMAKCQHENIVKMLGFSNDGDHFCLVYTYMSNGSLFDRLACLNNTAPLSWNRRGHITIGTAKGLKYLHENNHIHRDIKSANILLDDHFTPKISDFGLARASGQYAKTMMTEKIVGTTAYMAPEALRGEVTIKADIFSFGVILLEIISGLPPFDEKRNPAVLLDIKEEIEEGEATIEEYVDAKMGDVAFDFERMFCLACQCLNQAKNRRPNIDTVLHTLEDICYEGSGC